MSSFLVRKDATEFIREEGVKAGETMLANNASKGIGPKYCLINGRALYRREDLLAWIAEQAAIPPRKRRAEDISSAAGA